MTPLCCKPDQTQVLILLRVTLPHPAARNKLKLVDILTTPVPILHLKATHKHLAVMPCILFTCPVAEF